MEPRELETLLTKVGGKFKLVTLYQKRMRELQRGLPKLVLCDTNDLWDVVSKEINDSKVDLIMGEEAAQMRKDLAARESEDLAEAEKSSQAKLPGKAADEKKKAAVE